MTNPHPNLIPLIEWPDHHTYPSINQLRYLVFNAKYNGFESCIRRIGRRVLIDEAAYFRWVESLQKNGGRHDD